MLSWAEQTNWGSQLPIQRRRYGQKTARSDGIEISENKILKNECQISQIRSFKSKPENEYPRPISSVHFSHSVVSHSLRLQHARPPCLSATPGDYSNSCPLSQWWHPTISSSIVPFFSHLQSFPASVSFPMSQFFASGGQSIGISASVSVLPPKKSHLCTLCQRKEIRAVQRWLRSCITPLCDFQFSFWTVNMM